MYIDDMNEIIIIGKIENYDIMSFIDLLLSKMNTIRNNIENINNTTRRNDGTVLIPESLYYEQRTPVPDPCKSEVQARRRPVKCFYHISLTH